MKRLLWPVPPLLIVCSLLPAMRAGGGRVIDVRVSDVNGVAHQVGDAKDAKATVYFFTSVECPAANRCAGRLVQCRQAWAAKGVAFFAVYSNALDDPEAVRRNAKQHEFDFPVLLDPGQRLADALDVKVTPTVVVLDKENRVSYRGALDDNSKSAELVKKRYLRDALGDLLAGKSVAVPETKPVGCDIQRKLKEVKDPDVTYAGHVGRLLHAKCAHCHRPGQVAPFSLLTYDQARRWAANIKSHTQSRAMPPWKPANHGMFKGERWLAQEEIDLLARWVDAGAPLGDAGKSPPPPAFAEGWTLGEPDLALTHEEYDVGPVGEDEYRSFVLDPKLTEDRWVQAVEYRPGNPRIVHHCIAFIDDKDASIALDATDPKPGYSTRGTGPQFPPAGDLGAWTPGAQPSPYADGTAVFLPKGSKIAMEVHYHKNGKPEKDRTTLGLYFAKTPVKKRIRSQVVANLKFKLEPGAKRQEVKGVLFSPNNRHLIAILPHMHLIGKEIMVSAKYPDGTEKLMVHLPEWDFNWQETYHFAKPFPVPKGTQINLTCWFDNSADNPNNPNNPPKAMRWGEQTTDEMAVAYFNYTNDKEDK